MKINKPAYGLLTLAVIIFANPNFNAFDFLPDFIAAFIIYSLLSRVSDIIPYMAEARDAFLKLGIVTLVRLPAALVMFSNLHTGMDIVPLFTLTFTVLELILLYIGISNGARGLYYLAERSEATGIVRPFRAFGITLPAEGVRVAATAFVTIRAAANLLPQFCHLTFSDERMQYITNRLYAPLELGGMGLTLLCGILFAVVAISYLKSVKAIGGVADGVTAIAGEEKLARLKDGARHRGYLRSLLLLGVSVLFTLDINTLGSDGFNALPHFIFLLLMLIALLGLCEDGRMRLWLSLTGGAAAVASAVSQVVLLGFCDKYTVKDIAEYTLARKAYLPVEILSVAETVLTLAFIALLILTLRSFVRRHTGIPPESERYNKTDVSFHKRLTTGVCLVFGLTALTAILKCLNVFLIGSPIVITTATGGSIYSPRLPWLGTAIAILAVVNFLAALWLTRTLEDEVKYKYR